MSNERKYTPAERNWIDDAAPSILGHAIENGYTLGGVNTAFDLAEQLLAESIERYGPLEPEPMAQIQPGGTTPFQLMASLGKSVIETEELERLRLANRRYATVRRMNAHEFSQLYADSIRNDVPFDDLVDRDSSNLGIK